jgi:hypothetical protein
MSSCAFPPTAPWQSRKVRGTAPLSQASTSLHLGDVLQRVNNLTVQQWRPEDFSKVGAPCPTQGLSSLELLRLPCKASLPAQLHQMLSFFLCCMLFIVQNLQALVAENPTHAPVLQFLRMVPVTPDEPSAVEIAEWTRQNRCGDVCMLSRNDSQRFRPCSCSGGVST